MLFTEMRDSFEPIENLVPMVLLRELEEIERNEKEDRVTRCYKVGWIPRKNDLTLEASTCSKSKML